MDYLLNVEGVTFGDVNLIAYVLNLIINGLPSKPLGLSLRGRLLVDVLNLIINGLPSKLKGKHPVQKSTLYSFKPYYKWITF